MLLLLLLLLLQQQCGWLLPSFLLSFKPTAASTASSTFPRLALAALTSMHRCWLLLLLLLCWGVVWWEEEEERGEGEGGSTALP